MGGAVCDLLQKEVTLSAPEPAAGLGRPIPPVEAWIGGGVLQGR